MDAYCGDCGKLCAVITVDYGIGSYEYWGAKGYDSHPADVSKCCEADPFEDEELTEPYAMPEPEPCIDPYDDWIENGEDYA